ncbi:NADPH-dependent FMN reductase [Lacticaseibacillus kribbianus]|uniref:NADPH-dependent FMN reductase n=1 Tax=Lacticaseibacillus kribbianus TaxID=2926292 RepID=UPI001CD1BF22|nr:NADPH-dependent FMN reductase [Lacticaseibacillus kribbianus]
MNLIGIVGTNAPTSTNRQLLQYMQRHFKNQATITIQEIADFPAFDEPEDHRAPVGIAELSAAIAAADGVIIATPEYDHSIPAALKSLLEWLSYTDRPLIDKPVLVVGASYGALGTSRAQGHLRQILDAPELKARLMPGAEFLLAHSQQAFTADGDLAKPEDAAALDEYVAQFLEFVEITKQLLKGRSVQTQQHKQFAWDK